MPELCEVGGEGGLILPLFGNAEQRWPKGLRSVLYFAGLIWCFMGVAIIADVFMGAIERITSKRRRRKHHSSGRMMTEYVWNPTVANLTLMALGSSAPEILLSVIETTLTNKMFSGELGPSTIVGSAAFNLFIIIAVCVQSIPCGEVRFIKETQVYYVTAAFSIFAYVWLIIVLLGFSPNVVEPWEGILTFLFFPILVLIAYLADAGFLTSAPPKSINSLMIAADITKEDLAELHVQIRKEYGSNITDEQVTKIITLQTRESMSRARYRVAATRRLFGGRRLEPGKRMSAFEFIGLGAGGTKIVPLEDNTASPPEYCSIEFAAANWAVLENAGLVRLKVIRGGLTDVTATVQYRSRDGSAKAWTEVPNKEKPVADYMKVEGTLTFNPGETEQFIEIKILDDNTYEEDEDFFVDLVDASLVSEDESRGSAVLVDAVSRQIVVCATARITIIDDDMAGVISWAREEEHIRTTHEDQWVNLQVIRKSGSNGPITCQYKTENATALAGTDYEPTSGTIEFEDGMTFAQVPVKILAKGRYGTSDCFRVILEDVKGTGAKFDSSTDGGSDCCILTVYIDADSASMERVDKIMSKLKTKWDKAKIGHSSWKEQFIGIWFIDDDAEDDESDDSGGRGNLALAYVLHCLALPWKLLFALVPPVEYCGGWLCFLVSLVMIGGVTTIIGDLANLFGCVLPFMENEITAITFVALGTSLPDTFASKTAAEQDPFADASVGNVTGSNSVNVFLGMGLPWMIASIFWSCKSPHSHEGWDLLYQFDPDLDFLGPAGSRAPAYVVKAGSLAFSVVVFTCCAVVCLVILFLRRRFLGGELGGPKVWKHATCAALTFLWAVYLFLSVLKVKGVI